VTETQAIENKDIVVTEAMVDAGVSVLDVYSERDVSPSFLVEQVLKAVFQMERSGAIDVSGSF
jgi:hypothetical protein